MEVDRTFRISQIKARKDITLVPDCKIHPRLLNPPHYPLNASFIAGNVFSKYYSASLNTLSLSIVTILDIT